MTMESRGHILLVDDEAMVRDSLCEWLQMEGFSVRTAAGGEEALQLCKMFPFDVGVFDIRMPGMDGLTLLQKVHETWPALDVVMMTAYGTIESAVDCIQKGAYDYIIKPFPPEKLSLLVGQIRRTQLLRQSEGRLKAQLATLQGLAERFRDFINAGIFQQQSQPHSRAVSIRHDGPIALNVLLANLADHPRLSMQISSSLPTIQGDAGFLFWALDNCLDNARRAVAAQGDILISAEMVDSRKIALSIIDTGCGLSMPDRLFEPHHSAWQDGAGLGLGLWVARHLLDSMNAKIAVTTNRAGATQTTLVLPVFGK